MLNSRSTVEVSISIVNEEFWMFHGFCEADFGIFGSVYHYRMFLFEGIGSK